MSDKPSILVISDPANPNIGDDFEEAIAKLSAEKNTEYQKLILIVKSEDVEDNFPEDFTRVEVDKNTYSQMHEALLPYTKSIKAVVCRSESKIPVLQKVIPNVPFVHAPTETSLTWTTQKHQMRERLNEHDPEMTPRFTTVRSITDRTIQLIEKRIGYPLVIKPTGLAASLLVSVCYHREELIDNLENTFDKVEGVYRHARGRGRPKILVEQLMEGSMYSIDAYVDSKGKIYFCPPVHVKTGRSIGFDDFFGYQRITPVKLRQENIDAAEEVTRKAIEALGLRSTTTHVELMRTEYGWKIIELGPRMGGYRANMYKLAWGIDHAYNDLKIRFDEKPKISKKSKGYCVVLELFAKSEGILEEIKGIDQIESLDSLENLNVDKSPGEVCLFAKHGGKKVISVTLFNKSRSAVLADVRRIEKNVDIITTPIESETSQAD